MKFCEMTDNQKVEYGTQIAENGKQRGFFIKDEVEFLLDAVLANKNSKLNEYEEVVLKNMQNVLKKDELKSMYIVNTFNKFCKVKVNALTFFPWRMRIGENADRQTYLDVKIDAKVPALIASDIVGISRDINRREKKEAEEKKRNALKEEVEFMNKL